MSDETQNQTGQEEVKSTEGEGTTEGGETGASPVPGDERKEVAPMDFFDALREAKNGKRITRAEWADEKVFGFMDGGVLKIHNADGTLNTWLISDGDMAGEDWSVVSQ